MKSKIGIVSLYYFAAVFAVFMTVVFVPNSQKAEAFAVRSAQLNDTTFAQIIFDANVASSTATSSAFVFNNASTTTANASMDAPNNVFVGASSTISSTSTITLSASLKDIGNNALATTTQTLTPAIKIAAVRAGATGNALDEFVMLYNAMGTPFTASGTLNLHVVRGGVDTNVPIFFATSTIPGHGFFLITSANGYSGSIPPDASYSTTTDSIVTTSTAVYINTTSTASVNILDKVEWGVTAQITTSTNATSTFAATTSTAVLAADKVVVRKAFSGSSSSTMASGGSDSNKGNAYDTRDNANDFVLLNPAGGQNPIIKNSNSPVEFPFGGGQSDNTAITVTGSFPSGGVGEMVPTDLHSITFGFSKPANPTTISTSTVSLVVQGQGVNLCSTVTFSNSSVNGPPGQCTISGSLTAGTTYVFTIRGSSSSPSVADFSSNALNQPPGTGMGQHGNSNHDYQITFSPQSGFVSTPQVSPSVIGTFPSMGAAGIPANMSKISLQFSQAMSASFGSVTLTTGGGSNLLNNAGAFLSADKLNVTIPLASSLSNATTYTITVPTNVQNTNNISLPMPYSVSFTTGNTAYTTGPQILGHLPNITTGVPVNAVDVHAATDQNLDGSTIGTSTVAVTDGANNVLPGSVSYNPVAKEIVWVGTNVFQPSTTYTVTYNASGSGSPINNVGGLALQPSSGSVYQFSFTTSASADTTQPGVLFGNANSFSASVTFDEIVKKSEAENIANYTLTNGTSTVALSALNGNTATYNAATKTVILNGVNLTAGAAFTVSVSAVHDLSNNLIDPTKSSFSGTVQAAGLNGGNIGVGQGFIVSTSTVPTGFSGGNFGFVPQPGVRPVNSLANFTSGYSVNIPISKQILASGKIVLTFPSAFTLTNATADSFSPANNDINGPGTGTVTIASVTGNDTAHTITVVLGGVPTQGGADTHDFLHFDLASIGNSPVPNNSSGYTVDIRTLNGTTTLESFTSTPFFITAGGGGTLNVSITATGANSGTAKVYLFSPSTGPLTTSTIAFASSNATATFSNIPNGVYNLATDPIISLPDGAFTGQASPLPVSVNGATTSSITFSAASSLASSTVKIHATGAKKVSVFAGGPNGYLDIPVTTSNGTTTAVIYYPSNGLYNLGVGPQMNKTSMGPPPAPDYVMPKPVQITVTGGVASQSTVNFDLLAAGQTITGFVQDGSGKAIANANVYTYNSQGGFGTFAQSGANGSYVLNVAPGGYKLGVNAPGFPSAQEMGAVVDGSGNIFLNGSTTSTASVVIKLTNSGVTITGSVTDGTNPVQGAQVFAYCDPTAASNSCLGPAGNAGAQTDSSGAYTLYVGNGTWKVGAFIPGYGQQPQISVVVSGVSVSGKNFQPSATGTFKSVGGTVSSGGTGIAGAKVMISGTDPNGNYYSNGTISASDGTYSFASVPAGAASSYIVRGFAPSLGELAPTAAFVVNASNVTGKNLSIAAGRTINVNVSGNPAAFSALMKFVNTTTGASNFLTFQNNASGTIQVPNGATYAIDTRSPGFSLSANSLTLAGGTATYSTSTGQLDLTSGSNTVTLTLTFPGSTALSGTVKDGSGNLVGNAWVDVSNVSQGLHFGNQADANGAYSVSAQDGTYTITAYDPGYIPSGKTLTLASGVITLGTATTTASAVNLTVQKSSLSISGTVKVNGTAAPAALVKGAVQGGGTAVVVTGNDGTFTLPVSAGTWSLSAAASGFQAATTTPVSVTSTSVTGVTINLTTVVNLGSPTTQSITPSQGGLMRNTSGTVQVSIPANALGSSANSGQIQVTQTSAMVQTASAKTIGSVGQDIKAYDSSNNAINTLSDNVTISIDVVSSTFSGAGINSTSTAAKMKLGYFDTSLGDWVPIASAITYANSSGVSVTPNATLSNVDHITLSAASNHFSVFGPIVPTNALAPAAPSGVAAAQSGSNIVVSWTVPTTQSDGSSLTDLQEFEIYRDISSGGSFATQVNTSQVASGTTSFTDTTAVAGTTYYYKVTAANTSGNESVKSTATAGVNVPVAPVPAPSGGGGGGAPAPGFTVNNGAPTTATPAVELEIHATADVHTMAFATSSNNLASSTAVPYSSVLQWNLCGTSSQCASGSYTVYAAFFVNPGIPSYYAQNTITLTGASTVAAATANSTSASTITAATSSQTQIQSLRTQLNVLVKTLQALIAQAKQRGISIPPGLEQLVSGAQQSAGSVYSFARDLQSGSSGNDVKSLQLFLIAQSSGPTAQKLAALGATGSFGSLTKKALREFQKSVGIKPASGFLGPKTREYINSLNR